MGTRIPRVRSATLRSVGNAFPRRARRLDNDCPRTRYRYYGIINPPNGINATARAKRPFSRRGAIRARAPGGTRRDTRAAIPDVPPAPPSDNAFTF